MRGGKPIRPFTRGLLRSSSIALGYFPAAVTFGTISVLAGFSEIETVLISALVFAGGSQFAFVSLSEESILGGTIVGLFMNLRHLVYSIVTSGKASLNFPHLSAFGLTDEVFATFVDEPAGEEFLWGLEVGSYTAWVMGTILGAFAGRFFMSYRVLSESLLFSLTLLFFVLMISRLKGKHIFCAAISWGVYWSLRSCLGESMGLIVAGIIAPLVTMYLFREAGEER